MVRRGFQKRDVIVGGFAFHVPEESYKKRIPPVMTYLFAVLINSSKQYSGATGSL